jgi:hypothetical protein
VQYRDARTQDAVDVTPRGVFSRRQAIEKDFGGETAKPKRIFFFFSLCNQLLKRILNRFQISGIWLQAHFEIIEDRLLVGFRCGDFLELHVAQHDFVAPDRR